MLAFERMAFRMFARCAALLMLAVMPLTAQTTTAPIAIITGTVTQEFSGTALDVATVQLIDANNRNVGSALTDAAGRYRLPVAKSGTYRVRALRLGFLMEESDPTRVTTDTQPVINLRMSRNTVLDSVLVIEKAEAMRLLPTQQLIQGRLLNDEDNLPIEKGTLELRNALNKVVATTLTDGRGRFRMQTPSPGTYTLTGRMIGFKAAVQKNLRMQLGDTVLMDFRLSRNITILGPALITASALPWDDRESFPLIHQLYSRMERFKNKRHAQFILRDSIDAYDRRSYTIKRMLEIVSLAPIPPGLGSQRPPNRQCSGKLFFLNGMMDVNPIGFADQDDIIPLSSIDVIEVFNHPTIPAEFAVAPTVGGSRSAMVPPCEVVSVWYRTRAKRKN